MCRWAAAGIPGPRCPAAGAPRRFPIIHAPAVAEGIRVAAGRHTGGERGTVGAAEVAGVGMGRDRGGRLRWDAPSADSTDGHCANQA